MKNPSSESPSSSMNLTHILLIIVIVLNALGLYFLMGNSLNFGQNSSIDPIGIKKALLEIEYEKVGGKTNYDLQTQAQLLSLSDPQNPYNLTNLKKYIDSMSGKAPSGTGTTAPSATPPANEQTSQTLSSERVEKLLSDAVIEGSKSADIIVVEYSDMECPFCVRQYHETKLEPKLLAQYGEKVQFAFKNNRGVNHAGTEVKALGALCAQKLGGAEAYTSFYKTVMDGTTQEGGVYPVAKLADAAKKAKLDVKTWQECVDKKETNTLFAAQTAEAAEFGLNGTPGTLILNKKTGKYATIEGAYPYENFTQKIDELLK